MYVRRTLNCTRDDRSRLPRAALFILFTMAICPSVVAFGASTAPTSPMLPRTMQSGRGGGYLHPGQRNKRKSSVDTRVARLGTQLNLNDVQRFDLKRLLETEQAEANRLWNDQQIDPMERMRKLKTLQDDTQKRFHALLTEEQRKKYDQLRQQASRENSPPPANDKNLH